ncbi:protein kinase [Micromonospora sp. NPDC049903]|uniref:serine/threonine-protein kinase n=1 Tax=Micromonospora sp. NPDC049903 TaxID=3364276 RepID=UPI0037B06B86
MATIVNGRYELEELPVGRGGMGEVYLGRDIKLDREIAVKFIRFPDGQPDQDYVRRFVRESRITARLEHPGVPAVYDVGTHEGRPYLVMQRIRGISLADLVAEQGPLPVGWATLIAAQVCAVLAVAHRASLVHRDLKPSNLMLESDGGVKVLDFGLAVAPDRPDFSKITITGQVLGTPAYMAPEQIQANISGPATDLYALGCTLHEMLTGEQLFAGSTSYDVMSKQVSHAPVPVRGVRDDVPAELERLILDLLEKKPEDRPADASTVYRRLIPLANPLGPWPGVLRPPSEPSPTRMYAAMLSRIFGGTAGAEPDSRAQPPLPSYRPDRVAAARADRPDTLAAVALPEARQADSREPRRDGRPQAPRAGRPEVRRARDGARRLAAQARYRQAADVLAAATDSAIAAYGATDPDVVDLRFDLASALFDGGDYRSAAPVFGDLAAELAGRGENELVLRCRLKEATCQALTGQTGQALRQLDELLEEHRRTFGEDDPRTMELRRQIGLLQLGSGQPDAAEQTLGQLLADLTRLHGPRHTAVRETSDLLTGLRRSRTR